MAGTAILRLSFKVEYEVLEYTKGDEVYLRIHWFKLIEPQLPSVQLTCTRVSQAMTIEKIGEHQLEPSIEVNEGDWIKITTERLTNAD
jgi:hypothetical protein